MEWPTAVTRLAGFLLDAAPATDGVSGPSLGSPSRQARRRAQTKCRGAGLAPLFLPLSLVLPCDGGEGCRRRGGRGLRRSRPGCGTAVAPPCRGRSPLPLSLSLSLSQATRRRLGGGAETVAAAVRTVPKGTGTVREEGGPSWPPYTGTLSCAPLRTGIFFPLVRVLQDLVADEEVSDAGLGVEGEEIGGDPGIGLGLVGGEGGEDRVRDHDGDVEAAAGEGA